MGQSGFVFCGLWQDFYAGQQEQEFGGSLMRKSSRFAGLSVPFLAMWISAFFGPAAIGFTICCASVFLAGVMVICAEYLADQIKGSSGSRKPPT